MSMETSEPPNTKQVAVPFDVPRDPEDYRASIHFGQRLRERVPEELRDLVIEQTIRLGECRGVSPSKYNPDREIFQAFAFDYELEDPNEPDTWRVVVGIVPEAFTDPSTKHIALTIYANPHEDDRDEHD